MFELFKEYRKNPTRRLRDHIFNHHYKLACEIAHQFKNCCQEPFEDLLQLSSIGLVTAIERFDPDRGNAFSSFACPYIKGEICHYLRDKSSTIRIPRSLQALYQRGRKLHLSDQQTAHALGCSEWQWREAKAACANRLPLDLDDLLRATAREPSEFYIDDQIAKRILSLQVHLSTNDKQTENTSAIEPLPLANLDDVTRELLEMLFFERQPLKEVRRAAIASGIKAKDVKPLLLSAVLSVG
ncbi:MAG: sigma-70 family RNA polymerase sigma factor [Nostoc sp. DedVER02]|uniref:sigma-70 family RNA polymerase sigma factor n=1 Tax=unclassified Nostoc TaxID=2593658 RepID=UPI002AD3D6C4|nr:MULTISPECIES: sigma-70 family RNA polymerase sigma factor [unclassified Nostoc]MDZ7986844.1 sigma-70 family RNA polymerase sigma factor [Nostoc sp. DedVER02]MDZ8115746.1 sigma-70 family RNA polymerase sigma factor [Nostoc sp. DedVER01b]